MYACAYARVPAFARLRVRLCTNAEVCARLRMVLCICLRLRVYVSAGVADVHTYAGPREFFTDAQQCPAIDDYAKIKKSLIIA